MSFKFEFKIDYKKLTNLLDVFLKSHSNELTSIMGQCLTLQQPQPEQQQEEESPVISIRELTREEREKGGEQPDYKVNNRPLIGDSIPEDPLSNLFNVNPNADTTRYKDRNPNTRKGFTND